MHLRLPRVEHASWTISARHLGVVVGLAILTPIFTSDLMDAQAPAEQAITALVLDAPLPAQDKVELAQALGDLLLEQQGEVPDLHAAFAATEVAPGDEAALAQLEADLDDQLERAATFAFRDSFLAGALLALLALLTVAAPPWRRTS
jgi:hypothetical protein